MLNYKKKSYSDLASMVAEIGNDAEAMERIAEANGLGFFVESYEGITSPVIFDKTQFKVANYVDGRKTLRYIGDGKGEIRQPIGCRIMSDMFSNSWLSSSINWDMEHVLMYGFMFQGARFVGSFSFGETFVDSIEKNFHKRELDCMFNDCDFDEHESRLEGWEHELEYYEDTYFFVTFEYDEVFEALKEKNKKKGEKNMKKIKKIIADLKKKQQIKELKKSLGEVQLQLDAMERSNCYSAEKARPLREEQAYFCKELRLLDRKEVI